jgi:hypothetical protein
MIFASVFLVCNIFGDKSAISVHCNSSGYGQWSFSAVSSGKSVVKVGMPTIVHVDRYPYAPGDLQ